MGVDAGDDAATEAATQIRRFHSDPHLILSSDRHLRIGKRLQRRARERRHLARNAVYAQAMRQIGRKLEGEQGVIEPEVIADVLAHRRIGWQFQQATVVIGQLEFSRRAQHAVALHPAQRAHLDHERLAVFAGWQFRAHQRARHLDAHPRIGRATDDLQQAVRAGIHLAHAQAVGIRVLRGLLDFGHDDASERRRDRLQFFHLQPGHGERISQLLGGQRRVADGAEPGFGKLHGASIQDSVQGQG